MGRGVRFAPSPTGRLHVGNLRSAWIAHWWALHLKEPLVIRSEDIDRPRNLEGAHELQLQDLRAVGVLADEIIIQSSRRSRHWNLFVKAIDEGRAYPCTCSRKDVQTALAGLASAAHDVPSSPFIYDGNCRPKSAKVKLALTDTKNETAWRFRNDDVSGNQDFIIARTKSQARDLESFTPAYHWACAIDDFDGDYRLLVRAWDLESAAQQQRAIQHWLNPATQKYAAVFHTSLITEEGGQRLEKRSRGVTLDEMSISPDQLVKLFLKSFVEPTGAACFPNALTGEKNRELKLSALQIFR